jgi:hypothetical protein
MANGTCSAEGCEKPVATRGWCGMHYARWKRNGTLERLFPEWCSVEGCGNRCDSRGWCSTHYRRWRAFGSVELTRQPTCKQLPDYEARFWAKVDKTDGCWQWTAATSDVGYGIFWTGKRLVQAHRWSWEQANGPIPAGLHIDHLCHNTDAECFGGNDCPHRRCVNPAHLEPVTQQQNMARSHHMDRKRRRREAANAKRRTEPL